MAVTSIKVGTLELLTPGTYAVGNDTLYDLQAGSPTDARLVQMADRYPAYVGKTQTPRSISLLVFLLATDHTTRMTNYDTLVSALTTSGLVALTFVDGATTKRYWCHVDSIEPSQWMTRAAVSMIAPNPVVEVV